MTGCHQCPLSVLPQALALSLVVTSARYMDLHQDMTILGHTASVQQREHGSEFWSGIQDREGTGTLWRSVSVSVAVRPEAHGLAQLLAEPLVSLSSAGMQAQEGRCWASPDSKATQSRHFISYFLPK